MIKTALTKKEIVDILRNNGLETGMIVEVHCSLSSTGYIVGGAQTLVDALMEVVGYQGTILMPVHSAQNSEPTFWKEPSVDCELAGKIRESMPAFHRKESDVDMGSVTENFRRREGVVMSSHPTYAFAAWGKYAKFLCNHQSLHFCLSEESATARMVELKASVLLIGVDYDQCTCMHLAEYRSDVRPIIIQGAAIEHKGERIWKQYLDILMDSSEFKMIGRLMEKNELVKIFDLGKGKCRLFECETAVSAAERYFKQTHVTRQYQTTKMESE